MSDKGKNDIRDMRNGDWYWIHRIVIREYARNVGAVGILVYNFLVSLADRGQACFPSQGYIANSLGYSRSYINETLKRLERHGLIRIERKGRYHCVYHLLKVRCQPGRTQMSTIPNSGVSYTDTNNNKITRIINNIDNENVKDMSSMNSGYKASKGFRPSNRHELLASDIADALNDRKCLPLYLSYARRFPEPLLRRVLGEVKEIPQDRIRKSRAALFNHIIRRYAQSHKNHRD